MLLTPFLWGCGKGFEALSNQVAANSQCLATFVKTAVHPDGFTKNKVLVDNQLGELLDENKEYVATVDRACLRNANNTLQSGALKFKKIRRSLMAVGEGHASTVVSLNGVYSEDELNEALLDEPCVVGISENKRMHKLALPNDTYFSANQKNLSSIGYNTSYYFYNSNLPVNSANKVIIAIIDDGVNINHPDLKANMWVNEAEKNGIAGVDDDKNGYIDDKNGYDFSTNIADPNHKTEEHHGSHVAGLAAAVTNNGVGISSMAIRNIRIMALNVFGSAPSGATTADVSEAINYAVANGAKVINISLGTPGSLPVIRSTIQSAVDKGVVVVAASGNNGEQITADNFYSPSGYAKDISGMLSVGASDASHPGNLCSFSNYSSTYVEISAPGCNIVSGSDNKILSTYFYTEVERNYNYVYLSGTSMASPQVAGAAALAILTVRERENRWMLPPEVENLLVTSAQIQSSLSTLIKDGAGLNLRVVATTLEKQGDNNNPSACTQH
ncbi:MAG: hypothetical protein A2Z20_04700 [Bdellovibrionales bacterium RBG_16_40_8]|nr:MAG: hypothetical protein A2Z20_04700 [Bdellovibrionales bacterium RBG_16_40_8]